MVIAKPIEKKYTEEEVRIIIEKTADATIKKVLGIVQEQEKTYKFPHALPKDFKWESITIKFIDGHNVQIVAGDNIYKAMYKEMGFEDSRKVNPDQQWIFLRYLSKNRGSISWDDKMANDKLKKKKQLLSKTLRDYFGIKEDPFYSYRKEKSYKIKINLVPETGSISIPISNKDDEDDDLGIRDYINNQTH